MNQLNDLFLPFHKTLIVALIGALIGQLIIQSFSIVKRKIDLKRKEKMIKNDLINQSKILDLAAKKYNELKQQFLNRDLDYFTTSIFHTLQLDIYKSVSMIDLHSIFKEKLFDLVEIYKSIEFIKENGPYLIYSNYLEFSEKHSEEKKDEPDHERYCETELNYIDIAVKNIDNNLTTISSAQEIINKLNRKKNWL